MGDTNYDSLALSEGLKIAESPSASARMGVSGVMVAGAVTVATTAVTANSRIFLCHQGVGAAIGSVYEDVGSRVAGTSFAILSTNGADVGTVAWFLVEPAS